MFFLRRRTRHKSLCPLYDNADIAVDPRVPHIRTRQVKALSRLDFVRGIKVSAPRKVLGNYTKAAEAFRDRGEFGILCPPRVEARMAHTRSVYFLLGLDRCCEGDLGEAMSHRSKPPSLVAGGHSGLESSETGSRAASVHGCPEEVVEPFRHRRVREHAVT